jgi:hypothetical protein
LLDLEEAGEPPGRGTFDIMKARLPLAGVCRAILCLIACGQAPAVAGTVIPLSAHSEFTTFYLTVDIGGGVADEYLLDTGAGYMTITDATLAHLQRAGRAKLVHEIQGHLADGRVLRVPVYLIDQITIGRACLLRDVEAAVLPGARRGLLGLNVLRRTSPFQVSVDPPALHLSNCLEREAQTASASAME